ncbi:hypothetical protein V8B55DRAFT_1409402 [Mucor lusitanicus]|uniref:Uncharacterized protein n=2 Tax=Mucor circinelloides f. lusitanicus TaxID=29924 RepID=A0A168PDJ7_MUCCL|nr:hypothetical protein FB192DRAFT_1342184 [Mucor lusitanicus]OAD07573.1 hypothetical protein MUCCIDRAFT_157844 [Mucor lusitanicus CBS 277.49]
MACSFSSTRNNNGASNKRPRAESVSSVEDNSDVDNVQSTVHDEFRLIKKAIESVLNPTDISSKPRSWSPIAEIDQAAYNTYKKKIIGWITKAVEDGHATWDLDRRVDSRENAATILCIYQFVKTQINHVVMTTRPDAKEAVERDWSFFTKDRIQGFAKTRFPNLSKKQKEGPEVQDARLRKTRRKQRRVNKSRTRIDFLAENPAITRALKDKFGDACILALKAEEVQSDEESDSEDPSKPWRVFQPACRLHHPKLEEFYQDVIREIKNKKRAEDERLEQRTPVKQTHPHTDDCSRASSMVHLLYNLKKKVSQFFS